MIVSPQVDEAMDVIKSRAIEVGVRNGDRMYREIEK
jgi:hypothetical protein